MQRTEQTEPLCTSAGLRREVSARNLLRSEQHLHEVSLGQTPAVLYAEDEHAKHGNFYPPAYRRILKHPGWRGRLDKAYTASARLSYQHVRKRRELDTACSSDALLMNLFCAPGTLRNPRLRSLLDISAASALHFGYRTRVPLIGGYDDRTEADLAITSVSHDTLLIEAKLTETGFQCARPALLDRYPALHEIFDVNSLPRNNRSEFLGYQLIRNVLAAHHHNARFAILLDSRRHDLQEQAFRVFAAVRTAALRSQLRLYTWQELAACTSKPLQRFLCAKYGIFVR